MHDRFFESVAGDEQVKPHRRGQVTELHGRKKHDAEMNGMYVIACRDRQDQRHNQHDRRENIQDRAQYEQEHEQENQECR